MDGRQCEVAQPQPLAVTWSMIGPESVILAPVVRRRQTDETSPRPFGQHRSQRRMVAMRMRHHHPSYRSRGGQDGLQVPGVIGTRVEHGYLLPAQQVGVGSGSRHQARRWAPRYAAPEDPARKRYPGSSSIGIAEDCALPCGAGRAHRVPRATTPSVGNTVSGDSGGVSRKARYMARNPRRNCRGTAARSYPPRSRFSGTHRSYRRCA